LLSRLLLNAAVNGAGHAFGYKSFENDATNLKLLALITFGEGLHNNHHARLACYPASGGSPDREGDQQGGRGLVEPPPPHPRKPRGHLYQDLNEEQVEERFLGMQPILGLVEDTAPWPVYDPGGYLLAPVRR
jgi:hypothetical protein